jgi:hypothetical protein
VGGEFQINAYTTQGQDMPAVAAFPDGGFVVVWESTGGFGTDSGSYIDAPGEQGQRYRTTIPVPARSSAMGFALGVALLLEAGFALRR